MAPNTAAAMLRCAIIHPTKTERLLLVRNLPGSHTLAAWVRAGWLRREPAVLADVWVVTEEGHKWLRWYSTRARVQRGGAIERAVRELSDA